MRKEGLGGEGRGLGDQHLDITELREQRKVFGDPAALSCCLM